jgi:hypothetical protein
VRYKRYKPLSFELALLPVPTPPEDVGIDPGHKTWQLGFVVHPRGSHVLFTQITTRLVAWPPDFELSPAKMEARRKYSYSRTPINIDVFQH